MLGAHVSKFVLGFGPCIYKRVDKHGTEIRICAIPMNGFADLRRFPWSKPDLDSIPTDEVAWQLLTPHKKVLIALAGSATNFTLAAMIILVVHISGPHHVDTLIDVPVGDSLAYESGLRSGDRIKGIDGRSTDTWQAIGLALLSWTGKTGTFDIAVERNGENFTYPVQVSDWLADQARSRPIEDFGIRLGRLPVVGHEAVDVRLQQGDRILTVNSAPVKTWAQFSDAVIYADQEETTLEILRNGASVLFNVQTERLTNKAESGVLRLSVEAARTMALDRERSVITRIGDAVIDVFVFTYTTIVQLLKMLIGDYGFSNLFGVLQLTQLGTPAAEVNWQTCLLFFALISILGCLINLLPGIITDGSDIISAIIELIRKKPLSKIGNYIFIYAGTLIGAAPLVLVITLDLMRVFS